jgi:predicted nucleic acid-binding Zn ribbon protein
MLENCPSYGKSLQWGMRFCPSCGTDFNQVKDTRSGQEKNSLKPKLNPPSSQMLYCPTCGTAIEENGQYCHLCGEKFNAVVKGIPRETRRQLALGIVGIVLFLIIAFPVTLSIFVFSTEQYLIEVVVVIVALWVTLHYYSKEEIFLAPKGVTLLDVIRARGWFRISNVTKPTLKEVWIGGVVGVFLFVVILPVLVISWQQPYLYLLASICLIGPIVAYLTYKFQYKVRCPPLPYNLR